MATGKTNVFTVKRNGKTYFLHSVPMYYFSLKQRNNAVPKPTGYKVKPAKRKLPMLERV